MHVYMDVPWTRLAARLRESGRLLSALALFIAAVAVVVAPRAVGQLAPVPSIILKPASVRAAAPANSDPAGNIPANPSYGASGCDADPSSTQCGNDAIAALNNARAALGQPAYSLPANFLVLPVPMQLLLLSNQDRAVYGLPLILGLNPSLNTAAQGGVNAGGDPSGLTSVDGQSWRAWASNWAAGWSSALYSYYEWMYDDGPGSSNIDCTATNASGCWGHRENTLANLPGSVAMGVGVGPRAFTELYESFGGAVTYLPVITGLSAGTASPGQALTITGAGLIGTSSVWFNNAPASVTALGAFSITVLVPVGSGAVDVWVQTAAGSSPLTIGDRFTYPAAAPSFASASMGITSLGYSLGVGGSLTSGQELTSPDGRFTLQLQNNGDVVESSTVNGRDIWGSNTAGSGGTILILQGDLNLVLYTAAGVPVWWSGTSRAGDPSAQLVLQSDGNLVLYDSAGAIWCSGLFPDRLGVGMSLTVGQWIQSADGRYTLVLQGDGNLVIYGPTGAIWSSGTFGNPYDWAVLQGDGNFVIYRADGRALWCSRSFVRQGVLIQQSDGNLVQYVPGGVSWDSGSFR